MEYVLLILLLPALGSIIAALFGRNLSRRLISWITVGAVGLSFLLVASVFIHLLSLPPSQRVIEVPVFVWSAVGQGASIHLGFLLDPLSLVFMSIITGVGSLIHLYSIGYMHDDEGYSRYFSYLNLFIVAMLLLVMADNFLFLLIGWAGVGLASYLLIGFWYFKPQAVRAARKAFIVNVAGDVGITLAIFLLWWHMGSISYAKVFTQASSLGTGVIPEVVAFLLFLGAAAKSAQFPLHVWLPDAMEGPTPVSALIHAATMVTAGVYLVARTYPLFHQAPVASHWVVGIAAFTAFFAATIGIAQHDIKRILAYSTVSQLGYMFMAVGSMDYSGGVFHMVTHAFFKALLFLGAGSVIHAVAGEQEIWKMGGLRKKMSATFLTFMAATLAISAFPGFSGFFSKDQILGTLLNQGQFWPWLAGVVTAGLTSFYMFRLVFVVFYGEYRGSESPHESPSVMTIPLWVLGVLATVAGILIAPFGAWDLMASWLHPALSMYTGGLLAPSMMQTNWLSTGISTAFGLSGIAAAWLIYGRVQRSAEVLHGPVFTMLERKWYIDELGLVLLVRPTLWIGRQLGGFDRLGLDRLVMGIAGGVREWGESLRPLQSGYLRRYAITLLLGAVVLTAYFSVKG